MEAYSNRWGPIQYFEDKVDEVTVFCKTADHLYNFFDLLRDKKPTPVRWSNYILGRRQLRMDYDVPGFSKLSNEEKLVKLEQLIQEDYDNDDLPWMHVEKIEYPVQDYSDCSEDNLFEIQDSLIEEGLELERKLQGNRLAQRAVGTELGKRDINW